MIHTSTKFLAIPKEWEWSEDLEDGIYPNKGLLTWVYNACTDEYVVWYDDIYHDAYKDTYSKDKYWIFIEGKLVN